MSKSLGYYVETPATRELERKYGTCLQNLTLAEKMLVASILANVLLEYQTNPGEDYTIETEIDERLDLDISEHLQESLIALDGCTAPQVAALNLALSSYISDEVR